MLPFRGRSDLVLKFMLPFYPWGLLIFLTQLWQITKSSLWNTEAQWGGKKSHPKHYCGGAEPLLLPWKVNPNTHLCKLERGFWDVPGPEEPWGNKWDKLAVAKSSKTLGCHLTVGENDTPTEFPVGTGGKRVGFCFLPFSKLMWLLLNYELSWSC